MHQCLKPKRIYIKVTSINSKRCSSLKRSRKAKFHVSLKTSRRFNKFIPFSHLFQVLFELEKRSSLVTSAFSATSCTCDTASLHSSTRLAPPSCDGLPVLLVQDLAVRAQVSKLDSYNNDTYDDCIIHICYFYIAYYTECTTLSFYQ